MAAGVLVCEGEDWWASCHPGSSIAIEDMDSSTDDYGGHYIFTRKTNSIFEN